MREIRIEDVLKSLKKNFRIILITTLLMTLGSIMVTNFIMSPKYESSTKVFIGKEQFINLSTDYTNEEVNMYQRLIKTYSELLKTKDLMSKSIENAGQDISVKEALTKVQAIPVANTQILQIKYTSDSREESYNMVYGITEEFMKLSKKLYPKGHVYIIQQPIIPEKPIGPNKKMNIAIGALFGIAMGVGIIVLKEYMNNTFTDKEELEEILQVSCIGTIPYME